MTSNQTSLGNISTTHVSITQNVVSPQTQLQRKPDKGQCPITQFFETKTETTQQASQYQTCPICFEPLQSQGTHRAAVTVCGHLFGESCITKWINSHNSCPTCKARTKKGKKVIRLYDVNVQPAVEDVSLQEEIKAEKQRRQQLETELEQTKKQVQQLQEDCERARKRQKTFEQQSSLLSIFGKEVFDATCMELDVWNEQFLIAQTDDIMLLDLQSLRSGTRLQRAPGMVRAMLNMQSTVAVTTMNALIQILDKRSGRVEQMHGLKMAGWSLCLDPRSAGNAILVGQGNGQIKLFDMRIGAPISDWDIRVDPLSPIHSLSLNYGSFRNAGDSLIVGTLRGPVICESWSANNGIKQVFPLADDLECTAVGRSSCEGVLWCPEAGCIGTWYRGNQEQPNGLFTLSRIDHEGVQTQYHFGQMHGFPGDKLLTRNDIQYSDQDHVIFTQCSEQFSGGNSRSGYVPYLCRMNFQNGEHNGCQGLSPLPNMILQTNIFNNRHGKSMVASLCNTYFQIEGQSNVVR
eukprot:TRINITY_DN4435_c0_g2_i1.p1 TRINITY_DN4435_c0_g2~~TRINITY_DN4435_c0_g2_i1.p1  ORF type:complete len:555 (-),score=19.68 TRINITY_DN4435_c0_g2_i1:275-1831(-)